MRPLLDEDFNREYLSWLNDPEVNRYSHRQAAPVSWEDMKAYPQYYKKNPQQGVVLAIVVKDEHIGNIALTNINSESKSAEISILIGKKDHWGKGYASEAIYLLTKHAFMGLGLNKVYAGSINPAFIRCVEKLGWQKEAELKEEMWARGKYHNVIRMALLKSEFKEL